MELARSIAPDLFLKLKCRFRNTNKKPVARPWTFDLTPWLSSFYQPHWARFIRKEILLPSGIHYANLILLSFCAKEKSILDVHNPVDKQEVFT